MGRELYNETKYDADIVILLQSEFQTPLQGHRLAALLRRGRSDSPRGQNR